MLNQDIIIVAHKLGTPIYVSALQPNPLDSSITITPSPEPKDSAVVVPSVTDSTITLQPPTITDSSVSTAPSITDSNVAQSPDPTDSASNIIFKG